MATSVETLGVDFRTRTKQLGPKEEARSKECKVRFSPIRKKRIFQKSHMRVGQVLQERISSPESRVWVWHQLLLLLLV